MSRRPILAVLALIAVIAGCSAPQAEPASSSTATVPPTLTATLAIPTDTPTPLPDTATPTGTTTASPTATSTPSRVINLTAVGDIMLGRKVAALIQAQGPQAVFASVQPILDPADILVGNLECVLSAGGTPQPKSYTLEAPPDTVKALTLAGFDLMGVANNHTMDYGPQGLADTLNTLDQNGISHAGAGANASQARAAVILERNGLRVAFLAYVDVPVEYRGFDAHTWIATTTRPGIAWADLSQMRADIAAAGRQADVVVVLLHAGYEGFPSIIDEQRQEAHTAIDAGAALVIGTHPHILQPIEAYHGGLIAYSLGNFVFDDFKGLENASIILRLVLDRSGVLSYDYVPVLIDNGLPRLAAEGEAPAIGTLVAPMKP